MRPTHADPGPVSMLQLTPERARGAGVARNGLGCRTAWFGIYSRAEPVASGRTPRRTGRRILMVNLEFYVRQL